MERQWWAALVSGALFGVGLVISGMTDPRVVLGFLDVAGAFNPALVFVLGGAVTVTVISFQFVLRKSAPLLDSMFHLPTRQDLDKNLIVGSALFGIGWGLAGYCPGPALVGLAGGMQETLFFVLAMVVGSWLSRAFTEFRK